jgi:polynucleotide 5'-kinase involved in rRNA processing
MFFFLQPNQYLKNSKPLSEEELQNAFREERSESNHERMMKLRERLKDLRNANVPIFDLTEIFQNTREAVYIDTCCHLNSRGNEIMGKEIVQIISQHYMKTGE